MLKLHIISYEELEIIFNLKVLFNNLDKAK